MKQTVAMRSSQSPATPGCIIISQEFYSFEKQFWKCIIKKIFRTIIEKFFRISLDYRKYRWKNLELVKVNCQSPQYHLFTLTAEYLKG